MFSRHSWAVAFALGLAFAPCARAADDDATAALAQLLEENISSTRGVTLHVNGQIINALVVNVVGRQWVELRNQQYRRIVVRLDRIDTVSAP